MKDENVSHGREGKKNSDDIQTRGDERRILRDRDGVAEDEG
jgi:hypothetical protein